MIAAITAQESNAACDTLQQLPDLTLVSIGPLRPRCRVERGTWSSQEHPGFPYRWDLCLAELRRAFPDHG